MRFSVELRRNISMRAAPYDQVYLAPIATHNARAMRAGASQRLLDREFGDEYRSPRLPAGWFILPSALVALVFVFIL
jgi:hypothetical protein